MTDYSWWKLITKTFAACIEHNIPRLGAALAFYTTFSVAPLLIISVAVGTFFFGEEAIRGHMKHELIDFLGNDGADGIQAMIAASGRNQNAGMTSSILGIVALFFGATGVFVELKDAMNTIWGVRQSGDTTLFGLARDRLLSFAMVLSVAFLLLVSLVLSAVLSAAGKELFVSETWAHTTDFLISSVIITLLFMLIFKYLPDTKIDWEDVWLGAIVTAMLFAVGKFLLGIYLGKAAIASSYGAVGSLVVFLLWAYYSAQILLLGAEFTRVFTEMSGKPITPANNVHSPSSEFNA